MEDSKKASRRNFLKASAAGLTGAAVASGLDGTGWAQESASPEGVGDNAAGTPAVEIEAGEIVFPNGMPGYFARPAGGDVFYDMSDSEGIELLDVAIGRLGTMEGADPERVAIAGYCQTGRPPMVYAAQTRISAAVVWYGGIQDSDWGVGELQTEPLDDIVSRLSCPLFGAFGSADFLISVENVQRLRDALERHRKSYEIHIYRDAPHGWLNDTMPGRSREELARAAWAAQQAQQRFLASVFTGEWPESGTRWRFESEIPEDYDFSSNVRL